MKKRLLITVFGLFYSMTFSSIYAYESLQGPTETLYWDKEKAYNGYTLFGSNNNSSSYLIDMEGNVKQSWQTSGFRNAELSELLPNGNVLVARAPLTEYDWEGNVVWKVEDPEIHHDFHRIGFTW